MKKVLLAGGTGLVGRGFLDEARTHDLRISTVGRRATGQVEQEIITDFTGPLELPPAEVAVCALGTTIAAAGSKAAFRAVDHDAVLAFARAARNVGVEHFISVSAVGADPRSLVFYSRVKGEAESDLVSLGFTRLDILQPGLLLGPREEHRPVEAFLQHVDPIARLALRGPLDRYAGIPVQTVSRAILALCAMETPGVHRYENRAMRRLSHTVR